MQVLRLETGDELVAALRDIAKRMKIRGAWFWAIGATDRLEITFYDLAKQKYIRKKFSQRLEILNITGNIAILKKSVTGKARKQNEIIIHAHGVFGKPNYSTIGGHIISCRISGTCEIYLQKTARLSRSRDSATGLNLLY